MIYKNPIIQDGKISTRTVGDRPHKERAQLKDTSLHQAAVCLQCTKKKCVGTERCFREVMGNGKKTK